MIMIISEQTSKREQYPRVEDFYNGKSVLITGAAGFVGMIIMEILLRTCPGIKSIYIHIREKKGVKPEERKEKLFQKVIFDHLKKTQPDALDKVLLVSGDISKPDLGMSEEDVDRITQDVSIVFHCAAEVSFVKSIKYLIGVNAIGTYYVIELCKKLKEIKALVFTSTFCSNCNRYDVIEEHVYRLPFPSERFIEEFRNGTDESVEALTSMCHPRWPNGYSFTKCLAENVVLENSSAVPSAVIRPGLVTVTWKAPLPGFLEKNSVYALLNDGVGKGFIKAVLVHPDTPAHTVPVDVVANCHIVAAWKVATQRCKLPLVVNCTTHGPSKEKMQDLMRISQKLVQGDYILPNTFRTAKTDIFLTKYHFIYIIMSFYEHYVPAYVIDLFLKWSGKKLRLVRLYHLYDKAILATGFIFRRGIFKLKTTNFLTMGDDLDETEKEKFYTDCTEATIENLIANYPIGYDLFDWKKDKISKESRLRKAKQLHLLTLLIKYSFLIIMFTMVYFITSKVYQLVL